jgi:hypothetical protein
MASTPDSNSSGTLKRYVHTGSPAWVTQQRQALADVITRRVMPEPQLRKLSHEIGECVLASSRAMQDANFSATSPRDLERMAEMYDALFFESRLLPLARHYNMSFRWSNRMTSAGGKTIRTGHRHQRTGELVVQYEIALSASLLFQTFRDLQRPIRVTGMVCTNRLQAMQRILEHELVHLAEMLVWDDSCCSAARFQGIAGRMFGHTEHKHELVTQHERAAKKYNIRVGSRVTFLFEGQQLVGKVNRITRRATVLVQDPQGQRYSDGLAYRKYYIPLSHLEPI